MQPFKTRLSFSALTLALAMALPAHADSHALIMTIDYSGTGKPLHATDVDYSGARRIALAMGVPNANIGVLRNNELTHAGMGKAIRGLTERIADGDKVFLYFSGHGTQVAGIGTRNRCTEGLMTADLKTYMDQTLEADLERLGAKASQVVMMNDSCFSGGAASKSATLEPSGLTAKFFPAETPAPAANASSYSCGNATNKMARALDTVRDLRKSRVLYIAASRDDEVAYQSGQGGIATQAWEYCLNPAIADRDRSGSISGEELRSCAQGWIDRNRGGIQHISLTGDRDLPLYFSREPLAGSSPARAAAPMPDRALEDIRAASSPAYKLTLTPARPELRIRQDVLEFSVTTDRAGYLYIIQVGSDGKTFNLLFPNKVDRANRVEAGSHAFPRKGWSVRSGGPAGTSYLLAVLSPVERGFAKMMDEEGVFASTQADEKGVRNLFVEASGAQNSSAGRYGASRVVAIRERAR
ncbi:MAG: DUF4384 domain-containing protein [Rhodocyclaceae bacterium]|nr:DUF4384 domain-containing protein [Rhodocyclaceae bacterium]